LIHRQCLSQFLLAPVILIPGSIGTPFRKARLIFLPYLKADIEIHELIFGARHKTAIGAEKDAADYRHAWLLRFD
jgi:hypothetical protein